MNSKGLGAAILLAMVLFSTGISTNTMNETPLMECKNLPEISKNNRQRRNAMQIRASWKRRVSRWVKRRRIVLKKIALIALRNSFLESKKAHLISKTPVKSIVPVAMGIISIAILALFVDPIIGGVAIGGMVLPRLGEVNDQRIIPLLGAGFPTRKKPAEIAKNSNDYYEELGEEEIRFAERYIICGTIGDFYFNLDIGGMSLDQIVNWSKHGVKSNHHGQRDQGIGAKQAMIHSLDNAAYLYSVKDGKLNGAKFTKIDGRDEVNIEPKFCDAHGEEIVNANLLDAPITDAYSALNEIFKNHGCNFTFDKVWTPWVSKDTKDMGIDISREIVIEAIKKRGCFTLHLIDGITKLDISKPNKSNTRKRNSEINNLKDSIRKEGQARATMEQSHVIFVNSYSKGVKATYMIPEWPEEMEDVEKVTKKIGGPFKDPITNKSFEWTEIELELRASKKALSTADWKVINNIEIRDVNNIRWKSAIPYGDDPGSSLHVYGHAIVKDCGDSLRHLATTDRDRAPECPEARAIDYAIEKYIGEFIETIATANAKNSQKNRDTLKSQANLDDIYELANGIVDIDAIIFGENFDGEGGHIFAKEITKIYLGSKSDTMAVMNAPVGINTKLEVFPMGEAKTNDGKKVLASLEQLRGKKDWKENGEFFDIKSSNPGVIDVKKDFTLIPKKVGKSKITISSTEKLNGSASVTLEVEVFKFKNKPKFNFNPLPGPRNCIIDINFNGVTEKGKKITSKNCLLNLELNGTAQKLSNWPPKIRTSKGDKGRGEVKIEWAKNKFIIGDFETTDEIHIPLKKQKNDRGKKKNKTKFPKLIACGEDPFSAEKLKELGIPKNTIKASASLPTIVRDPDFKPHGVLFFNENSHESRAILKSQYKPKELLKEDSLAYRNYQTRCFLDVCKEFIVESWISIKKEEMPTTIDEYYELRDDAGEKLEKLYEVLIGQESHKRGSD